MYKDIPLSYIEFINKFNIAIENIASENDQNTGAIVTIHLPIADLALVEQSMNKKVEPS